jgi:hypothetical protein
MSAGEPALRAPRVAVVSVGDPRSISTWSGTTAGILVALDALGVDTRAFDLSLPQPVEKALLVAGSARTRNRFDAESSALTSSVRSLLAARRTAGAGLDGAIQIGTTFSLAADVPYVTLEDMTLRQARAIHPVFSRMSQPALAAWEGRRRRIYDRARMCTAASHWVARSLTEDYGVSVARVAVVGLGPNHTVPCVGREWGSPRFLFVGLDWERKGGPLLLRAFSRVRASIPGAALDIVGGHPPLSTPGVRGHGVLSQTAPRDRERLEALFASATCLVMPSLVEPFGIVHVEAAAAGIPSIVTAVGGARDTIGADGGMVVSPGNEDGLVEAMLCLCEPARARRMGEAARARSGLYTWSKVAERLLRALGLHAPGAPAPVEFL